jgi:hypothetical protein
MSDQWTDRLSEYLDDELDQSQRAALETHLAGCEVCTRTLAELQRVVSRAHALDDRPPASDLWPGIATRIGVSTDDLSRHRARRRVSLTIPQLIAAGLLLVAASAGVVRLLLRDGRTPAPMAGVPTPRGQPTTVNWSVKADSSGDHAVAELRQALASGQQSGRLSPATVRKLEHSLAVIDTAIAEAQRALVLDPNSTYLNHHLADTMRLKMEFLREANRIATART